MTTQRVPAGLDVGGRALWRSVTAAHELDGGQSVQLLEACRAKDRLDRLDALLCGDADSWCRLVLVAGSDDRVFELRVSNALTQANATANVLKQLLAALRLPDELGKRPQFRGPRGAQSPSVPGGKSRDRLRAV